MRLNSHCEDNDRSAGEDTFPPLVESNVLFNYLQKPANLPSNVQKVLYEQWRNVMDGERRKMERETESNLVNKANLVQIFLSMFISFLYTFRATMCPSSGEITVSMQHFVFVTLCRLLSRTQDEYQTVISTQSNKYHVSHRYSYLS